MGRAWSRYPTCSQAILFGGIRMLFMPSIPLSEGNAEYVKKQRDRFQQGRTPPDFPPNDSEINFINRGTAQDLTSLGRSLLGFEPFKLNEESTCNAGAESCSADGMQPLERLLTKCNSILD